ncbi:hypothetical protein P7C73_g3996, partial [Tremellales sp. Uapishka_1]
MAKGLSANPMEAYRKAAKSREAKKNKEARAQKRQVTTVKRDTGGIESEIRQLKDKTDEESQARVKELQSELAYINKTKEKYVKDHPEARSKVFREHKPRREGQEREGEGAKGDETRALYDAEGKLRDPTRSVYYHETYNPFGVPPPGMPYKEHTPEEESSDEDSDEEIVMPQGPPPESDEESDDSDDIPLPEGPPPPRPAQDVSSQSHMPVPMGMGFPPRPPPFPQQFQPTQSFHHGPPQHFQQPPHPFQQPSYPPFQQQHFLPPPSSALRPPFRPPPLIQDPLSDKPHQTYQARPLLHALPPRPPPPTGVSTPASSSTSHSAPTPAAATISAEPQLRDLRKEATAFVPRGVKRKKGVAAALPSARGINAAPGAGTIDEDGDERRAPAPVEAGGGLLGKLKGVLGDGREEKRTKVDDDYQKFLDGLGDLA